MLLRRVVIAPDKFKGSLSASEAAAAMNVGYAHSQALSQASIASPWLTAARAP